MLVEAGETIPGDGEVTVGIASVDESAITGESAPVIRESGGDRSAVTGGTRVLSDWLIVRITANPGETFLDKMIAMVEGAKRQKTPNEIALDILLAGLTLIFLLATVTLVPFSIYSVQSTGQGSPVTMTVIVALLICLIPTTIGGLLSAIGIAGMDRMIQANVIAMSGKAVEAAGDVDVLLLDKTGTITLGNREATEFLPVEGTTAQQLADAAQLASLADETPEGRSIVILAKKEYGIRERDIKTLGARFIPFTAKSRMSGVNLDGREIRKGAADAIEAYVQTKGGRFPEEATSIVRGIAVQGGTPLVVVEGSQVLGVIRLSDVVKGGIRERFSELRRMGIRTVMITGDNPLTAAAVAAEAGVDDFLAQATPEAKLNLIRSYQAAGPSGRHDGRRDERRAGAGAGGRGRGHEHGHAGGEGGGKPGGPRLQSHETDRDRRDREAAPHDAGHAHDLQHLQRCGQIFRHSARRLLGNLSGPGGPEHHGPVDAAKRHPVGGHLQRPDHCRLDSPGAARRPIPPDGRRRGSPPEPDHLRRRRASLCPLSGSRPLTCCLRCSTGIERR